MRGGGLAGTRARRHAFSGSGYPTVRVMFDQPRPLGRPATTPDIENQHDRSPGFSRYNGLKGSFPSVFHSFVRCEEMRCSTRHF
jgi:hypothetical protein